MADPNNNTLCKTGTKGELNKCFQNTAHPDFRPDLLGTLKQKMEKDKKSDNICDANYDTSLFKGGVTVTGYLRGEAAELQKGNAIEKERNRLGCARISPDPILGTRG